MQKLSLEQRRVVMFMLGFGLGAIVLGGTFRLLAGAWRDVPLLLVMVGALVSGLLGLLAAERERDNSTLRERLWAGLTGINAFLAYQTSALVQPFITGTAGRLARFGLLIVVVGLILYLNRLYQDARDQQTAARSGRRLAPLRWISAAILGLLAIQLGAFAANNAFRSSPCSRLDLSRRLAGCQGALRVPDGVINLSYARDGRVLATTDIDGQISLWSLPDRTLLRKIETSSDYLYEIALAPDSGIVAGSSDNSLYLWRTADGAPLHILKGHTGKVRGIAFSPDGNRVVAATQDDIRVWRVSDGALLQTLTQSEGRNVALAPDGVTLLVGGYTRTIQIWDIAQGTLLREIDMPAEMLNIRLSPDGTLIASSDKQGKLYLWRFSDGKLLRSWSTPSDKIDHVVFSPDGTALASSGSFQDETVRIWRVADGTQLRRLPLKFDADGLAFAPDNRTIVMGAFTDVYLWQYR